MYFIVFNHITGKWEENEARRVNQKSFVCMSKSRPSPENERQLSTGLGLITQANECYVCCDGFIWAAFDLP